MRRRITTAKREEIEAEQKILENKIVRPFETLADLPISYNEPPNGHYEDILKNPLTIKDSAVLYNSLIRSRSTYVYHAPMFKLHWVKQTAYAKKLAEMDKEKQKEILNDPENKRRFAKATTNSLEARTRTPVLSPDVNARDVMSKLCESSITLGPHTMDIRIFIAKDSRSEKSRAISEISKVGGPASEKNNTGESVTDTKKTDDLQPTEGVSTNAKPLDTDSVSSIPPGLKPDLETTKTPTLKESQQEKEPESNSKAVDVKHENPLNHTPVADVEEGKALEKDSGKGKQTNNELSSENTALSPKPSGNLDIGSVSSKEGDSQLEDKENSEKTIKNIPSDSEGTEKDSSETKDPSEPLVAGHTSGKSSISKSSNLPGHSIPPLPQVLPGSTKSSISQAPKSVPQPSKPALAPGTAQPNVSSVSSTPKITPKNGPSPVVRPSPTNLQSIDNTIMISNLNAIAKIDLSLNDLMKEVALGKASEVQITRFKKYIERAKQMGPQPHHAELYFNRGLPLPANFPRPYQARPVVEKKAPPKPKVFNPMKLTAFQERYLHNATLVFEFLENPNVRYIIPQDSICEVLKPELPTPQDAEAGTEYNDILISHMWIHNIDEMEQYEKYYSKYEAEVKKRKEEEEANQKEEKSEENPKPEADTEAEKLLSKPESRSLRTKKKAPPPRKKKLLVPPEYPHIKYTTFSFTIHNIPSRFVPIFINSMKPLKKVQEHMEHILKTGTRITSFYLWYQVDARLDEEFAENLRNTAVLEEKKMTGFVPPVEPKKRKPRENKNPRTKRQKEMSPAIEQGSPLDPSSSAQPVVGSSPNPDTKPNTEVVKPPFDDKQVLQNESVQISAPVAEDVQPSTVPEIQPKVPI